MIPIIVDNHLACVFGLPVGKAELAADEKQVVVRSVELPAQGARRQPPGANMRPLQTVSLVTATEKLLCGFLSEAGSRTQASYCRSVSLP